MRALRDKETGCPWDLQQDFRSLAPYAIEEAYEVADAIERGDFDDLRDELGDLLLQVVFHAQLAQERGLFTFDDVVKAINGKMLRRHPHVFGDESIADAEAQTAAWEDHKKRTRSQVRRRCQRLVRHQRRSAGMAARYKTAETRGDGRI